MKIDLFISELFERGLANSDARDGFNMRGGLIAVNIR